jgi:hypothetical protein
MIAKEDTVTMLLPSVKKRDYLVHELDVTGLFDA